MIDLPKIIAGIRPLLLELGIDDDEVEAAFFAVGTLDEDRQRLCASWTVEVTEVQAELRKLLRQLPDEVWKRMLAQKTDRPERRKLERLYDRVRRLWKERPALLKMAETVYRPEKAPAE